MDRLTNSIMIPTSIGDLVDRITILKIKSNRIKNDMHLTYINTELELLLSTYNNIKNSLRCHEQLDLFEIKLMNINSALWDYEDQIRQQTKNAEIANTAKAIIATNNLRASIKYAINSLLNSSIVEIKSYTYHDKSVLSK